VRQQQQQQQQQRLSLQHPPASCCLHSAFIHNGNDDADQISLHSISYRDAGKLSAELKLHLTQLQDGAEKV